jgi:N4-gp56 family major capsid protein
MHTIAAEAMKQGNPDFIPVEKYRTGKEMEGEEGMIGETIVIASPQAPIKETAPGVYECVTHIFGKDHTAHIPVRGKNATSFIYQPIGSSGASDALKRVGTAGWKSWLGAKVLYPERLGTVTVTVNY